LFVPYIADSIRYLKGQGIDLYQTQSGDDFAINGINYYVAGRLLWDTSLDERALLDDFYAKGFGKAAPTIRRFHERLQQAWTAATQGGEDVTCNSIRNTRLLELFTPDLLEKCNRDLSEATKAADDDRIRQRVEFYRKGLRYTELTVAAVEATRKVGEAVQPDRDLARKALETWEQRESFTEELKNDFVVAYFWVKYNDFQRDFNPMERLRKAVAQ
jgi:hypothetical protein